VPFGFRGALRPAHQFNQSISRISNQSVQIFNFSSHLGKKVVFPVSCVSGAVIFRARKSSISRTSSHPASSQPPQSHGHVTTHAVLLREDPRPRLPLLQHGRGAPGGSGSTILRCAPRFCVSCINGIFHPKHQTTDGLLFRCPHYGVD
jgi:hypothetical protein